MQTKILDIFRSWTLPLSLFVFSFLLRFSLISKGPYHLDCLTLAVNAQATLSDHQMHYQFGSGYPLTVLMAALFVEIAKCFPITDPVFAVNLMSVLLSSLSVAIFFLFLKSIFNQRVALFSSLALSLHPIFLTLSVYGNSHIVSIFFLLCSVYFLIQEKSKTIGSAICLGLMGAARIQDMILMLIPMTIALANQKENSKLAWKERIKILFGYISSAVFIAGVFHLPYVLGHEQSSYTSQLKDFWSLGLTTNFHGILSPYLARSFKIIAFTTTYAGMLIAGYGLVRIFRTNLRLGVFLITWFTCPLIFYGNVLTSVPRFLLLSILPILMAEGYGLYFLLKSNNLIRRTIIAVIFCVSLAVPLITNILPILQFRHTEALLPDWGRTIGQATEPNAKIIVGDEGLFINVYGRRSTLPRDINSFRSEPIKFAEFKKQLSECAKNNTPLYITGSALYTADPQKDFAAYIKNNYHLEFRGGKRIEDWHRGELFLETLPESLFRITK